MAFLHEHIILPLSDLLRGEQVHKYLRLLKEAEGWTPEQMDTFQQDRLHKLLKYAATEVPFYRDWFQNHNLEPQTTFLSQLPIVSKTIMRQEGIDRFTAEHFPVKQRISSRSSGSTGEPFSYYISKKANSVNTAAKLRTWYIAGYRLGDRYMKITNGKRSSTIKKVQDRINNCLFVPFNSITDDILESILKQIDHERPLFIRAYPSPLFLLAQYRNNHPGYTFRPRHIMTTGSTLPDAYRAEIEKAFGCDIIDSYSCEGTPNTYETPTHDGYNITNYYGIIEVLDNSNQLVTNGIGRVISTDLWNMAQPFIRYDTQDLVEVKNGVISRIIGRQSDTFIHTNGQLYTSHNFSHYFLYDVTGIDNYQIHRHADNTITFYIVTNREFNPDTTQQIINYWQECLSVLVSIKIVNSIPLNHNNKHQTIVND